MFKDILNLKERIKTIIKGQASMKKEMTALERKKELSRNFKMKTTVLH